MNKEEKENIHAFPCDGPNYPEVTEKGMTLRDYFAAKALEGICVNAGRNSYSFNEPQKIADKAYELADLMLKERLKS